MRHSAVRRGHVDRQTYNATLQTSTFGTLNGEVMHARPAHLAPTTHGSLTPYPRVLVPTGAYWPPLCP